MNASQIDQIGTTAFFVASLRAAESARPDRLADDPHAQTLLAAAGISTIPGDVAEFVAIMGDQVAVRTRYLDEALLAATAGGCRQVVLMASGMDSRGYRLPWPDGTELFELDQQPVLAFKQDVLADVTTRCPIRHVGIDLRDDWASGLRAAGFRDDRPAAWLVEGLLYALDAATADGLLEAISRLSAPGSTIAFDHVEMGPVLTDALTAIDPGLLDLWQSGPLDPTSWLKRHGWEPHVVELAALEREHGRPVHPAYDPAVAGSAHSWLGTGRRPA
ncbi:SAM-dependent methyltransferase [Pseudonocardia sp. CA-142604]|uniref:SAM-dependent methyltransferase n=1 Tax=Pseudonocardia sp. CA-142604 TaxID=3240024 RepID=UPI003D92D78C